MKRNLGPRPPRSPATSDLGTLRAQQFVRPPLLSEPWMASTLPKLDRVDTIWSRTVKRLNLDPPTKIRAGTFRRRFRQSALPSA